MNLSHQNKKSSILSLALLCVIGMTAVNVRADGQWDDIAMRFSHALNTQDFPDACDKMHDLCTEVGDSDSHKVASFLREVKGKSRLVAMAMFLRAKEVQNALKRLTGKIGLQMSEGDIKNAFAKMKF